MLRSFLLLIGLFVCQAHAQIIRTYAGDGADRFYRDGRPATAASLLSPYDVGIDSLGNVYIGDANT